MGSYMLGQRLLHCLVHVVPCADGGMQSVALPVTADPRGGKPVGFSNPGGKLVRIVFVCHFELPTW
jgi:hypothetical protein